MKKITKNILIYGTLASVLLGILLGIYTFVVYADWNERKDDVLEKLIAYKKQLDYLRQPTISEESTGTLKLGAVAIPSRVYDRNEKLIGEFYTERRTLVNFNKLPPYLSEALIASEDRKFYEHGGINIHSILRAFLTNLVTFSYSQGGSTLTQQLAKVLFTNQEKTIRRKIFEFFCTLEIEDHFTKNEILEMYLNLIYMGHGNYGVESASQYYYNKHAADLTLAESAILIGLLPSPTRFSPINDLEGALKRQQLVFNALADVGFRQEDELQKETELFLEAWEVRRENDVYVSNIGDFPDRDYRVNLAPYFLEYLKGKLLERFTLEEILHGGMRIHTTLDYDRQKIAAETLRLGIQKQKEYIVETTDANIEQMSPEEIRDFEKEIDMINGVFFSIDPNTGDILTMIGGSEYSQRNQFNRAIYAYRQIGSLMKPFVYYQAIEQRLISPATILADEPTEISGVKYDNYDGKYLGKITAYEALVKSRNTVAVRLLKDTGVGSLQSMFSDMLDAPKSEIKKRIPKELGVALGAAEFSPYELAISFGALANGGYRIEPAFLTRVEDSSGALLWAPPETNRKIRVLDPNAAFVTVSMLKGVFEPGGTAGWVANQRRQNPQLFSYEMAGKTGTTTNYRDAWFAGMTGNEVMIVWIGHDQNDSLGRGRSGGSLSAPVVVNYLSEYSASQQKSDIRQRRVFVSIDRRNKEPEAPEHLEAGDRPDFAPNFLLDDITYESFCLMSGLVPPDETACPGAVFNHPFLRGSEPGSYCPLHTSSH